MTACPCLLLIQIKSCGAQLMRLPDGSHHRFALEMRILRCPPRSHMVVRIRYIKIKYKTPR